MLEFPPRLQHQMFPANVHMGERVDRPQVTNVAISALTRLLLLATLLYVMIGDAPYQHDLVFDPLTGGAIMNPINRIIWLILLGMALPIVALRIQNIGYIARQAWPILVLYGWFSTSIFWSIDTDASSRRLLLYIIAIIICFAVAIGIPDRTVIHRTAAQACAIIILIDLGSWLFMPTASMTDLGLAAIHNHKNTLGAVMLFSVMVIAPYVLSRQSMSSRTCWLAALIACIALLLASHSKTSIALCVVAVLVGALLFALAKLKRHHLVGLTAGCSLIVASAILLWVIYCSQSGTDLLGPLAKETFTMRTDVWRFVIGEIYKRPWRGVGFAAFWDVNPAVQPSKQTDLWFARPDAPTNEAHNGYLDLAAAIGIPGLLLALFVLFRWILRAFLALRQATRDGAEDRYFALYLAAFPIVFFTHNWMESSYFTANSAYGFIILFTGLAIDARPRINRSKASIDRTSRA